VAGAETATYDLGFAKWVAGNISGADKLSMCMQCGMCSGSCPIGTQMDHGPRKLIMMIRAGMRDAVLSANTLWNCTQCYNCTVRCPRGIPVTEILQGLATVAVAEGHAGGEPTARFSEAFWWSLAKFGRTDERLVTSRFYFSAGLAEGVRKSRENLAIALRMIKARRMHLGAPHKIKRRKNLQAILAKAREIEARGAGEGD
jgi:quinone-modifying oxidoreductase subunit QmoC